MVLSWLARVARAVLSILVGGVSLGMAGSVLEVDEEDEDEEDEEEEEEEEEE